jgi:pyruvate kinase
MMVLDMHAEGQLASTPMLRQRRAKIAATLGPASASPEMIRKLFLAGVDVFRLNFSHGRQEDHAKVHASIRQLE